jgi:hypothetical protein
MGIDISGIGRASRVAGRHSDEVCEAGRHYPVGECRRWLEGRKPGCWVCGGKHYTFHASYGAFDTWQHDLSMVVHGVPASEVVAHPPRFKGRPFVELIDFPLANDVAFGPRTSARLYDVFVANSKIVKSGFQAIAEEAAASPRKQKRRKVSQVSAPALALLKSLGAVAIGSQDDPESVDWEWKWRLYLDFRRVFRVAADDGLVIVSV